MKFGKNLIIILAILNSSVLINSSNIINTTNMDSKLIKHGSKASALQAQMRKLWLDHILLSREYMAAAMANKSDIAQIAERLLKNQDDIGNAIVPYYGKEAGDKLAKLLREHILLAVDLMDAIKNNSNSKTDVETKFYQNSKETSHFLNSINPYWKENDVVKVLYDHLDSAKIEMTQRVNKQWKDDQAAFDNSVDQANGLGDAFADGIIKQFPSQF